jgi:hypothetical protein
VPILPEQNAFVISRYEDSAQPASGMLSCETYYAC